MRTPVLLIAFLLLLVTNCLGEMPRSREYRWEDFEEFSFTSLNEFSGEIYDTPTIDFSRGIKTEPFVLESGYQGTNSRQHYGSAGIGWALGGRATRPSGLFFGGGSHSSSGNVYGVRNTTIKRTLGIRSTGRIYGFRHGSKSGKSVLGSGRRVSGFRPAKLL